MAPFYLHYLVFAPALLIVMLWLAFPGRNPLGIFLEAIRTLFKRKGGKLLLGCYLFVTITNLIEGLFDERLTAALGYDLTDSVRAIEGDFVERVQNFTLALPGADILVGVLAIAYTAGYVAWVLFPSFALFASARPRAAGSYAAAFAANYLFAIPFYLFVPVKEVAWSGISSARPLLEEHWPGITADLRYESALDNCFPSLHVSISVTAMYFVARYGTRSMRMIGWPLTIAICLSVMVLGIHWGLDTAAGVPFGLLCAKLGERIFPPESQPEQADPAA